MKVEWYSWVILYVQTNVPLRNGYRSSRCGHCERDGYRRASRLLSHQLVGEDRGGSSATASKPHASRPA